MTRQRATNLVQQCLLCLENEQVGGCQARPDESELDWVLLMSKADCNVSMQAVAVGAAIQAAMLEGQLDDFMVMDVWQVTYFLHLCISSWLQTMPSSLWERLNWEVQPVSPAAPCSASLAGPLLVVLSGRRLSFLDTHVGN